MEKINYNTNRYYLNRKAIGDLGMERNVDCGVALDMWRNEHPVPEAMRKADSAEYLAFCEAMDNLKGDAPKFFFGDYRKPEVDEHED